MWHHFGDHTLGLPTFNGGEQGDEDRLCDSLKSQSVSERFHRR
jgi:hypothetical protein